MANEENHDDIPALIRLSGITVPDQRLAALAAGLAGTRTQTDALSRYDYGTIEPSARFTPPPSR